MARTNALSLYKVKGEAPGYALCPVFSLLNHNCVANCRYDMAKGTEKVTVKAARLIKAGEELSIRFIHACLGGPSTDPCLNLPSLDITPRLHVGNGFRPKAPSLKINFASIQSKNYLC